MKSFNDYLNETGEIGYVKKVVNVMAYADGLPTAHPGEVVVFEQGQIGQVISLKEDLVEILTFSKKSLRSGDKVARTGSLINIPVGKELLGKIITPFGNPLDQSSEGINA